MSADSPRERLEENAVGVASLLVTGLGLLALFAGASWFWLVFLLGFMVVVPLVALLFGDEEERAEWWDDWWGDESDWEEWFGTKEDWLGSSSDEPEAEPEAAREPSNRDALATLRYRYAQGDLTDEQFERKLERLLETETMEDLEDRERARERLYER
ncbi:SHOCT domain-containing protein [Halalkalicoccus tibetensis]|uniref:SHOCT domain-containing protein n=1 Tax=Halalkalicoccus tibetensis TaxID=175632 RepID=A0ABD5V278_9EURY